MEYDLADALHTAWLRIRPKLESDPDQLAIRKSRRRMKFMQNPPRAWCLAVRAADSRINACDFLCTPSRFEALNPDTNQWKRIDHQVLLESRQLRRLCRPVSIPFPGVTWREAAKMLGVDPMAIRAAINRGHLF